ncbi:MAG: hypothetical protein AB1505_07635 [Candidatus Latescibacterota bacterium]
MPKPDLPFGRRNGVLFAAGLACIVVGYVLLSIPPADGFLSLTLAPVLLVAGYCVLIPAAILVRDRPDAGGTQ